MKELYAVFDVIGGILPIIYTFAFILAVYKFRTVNSTVICIALLCLMESFMHFIRDPLLTLNSRELWYGTWTLLHVLTVFLLYKAHHLLKVNLAKITNTVAWTSLVLAFVQTSRYIDREFLGGEYLDTWYYLAINSINISVAAIVIMTLIRHREERHVGVYI